MIQAADNPNPAGDAKFDCNRAEKNCKLRPRPMRRLPRWGEREGFTAIRCGNRSMPGHVGEVFSRFVGLAESKVA
jgi:hypothetical protein